MSTQIAHNIEEKERTDDIKIQQNVDFTAMLLSDKVLQGLKASGFKKPSPIQLKAIPMGRFGYDLIIKAKSGTGKTAVFGIIALEMVDVTKDTLQVVILAPTREIAVQIKGVILSIGSTMPGLKVNFFIGGTPFEQDIKKIKKSHIAVAAPGRMEHLIKQKKVDLSSVRLFVLDEADVLCAKENFKDDVNHIYKNLPEDKQVIAASATYPEKLAQVLENYMLSPVHISLDSEIPFLLGLKQFVSIVKSHLNVLQQMKIKMDELLRVLSQTQFTQCMIFSNYQTRAESLSNNLQKEGWPSAYISAAQTQENRLKTYASLKDFKCRILVTTDLTARGIDAANVDLVINVDVPVNSEIYLHRMGRAGRYGSRGICITLASEGEELDKLRRILHGISGNTYSIPIFPKKDSQIKNVWDCNPSDLEQFCAEKCESLSETVCEELKDLSVEEKPENKNTFPTEIAIDKTIELLKTSSGTNLDDFTNCIDSLLEHINKEDEVQKHNLKQKITTNFDVTFKQNIVENFTSVNPNITQKVTSPTKTCSESTQNLLDSNKTLLGTTENSTVSKEKLLNRNENLPSTSKNSPGKISNLPSTSKNSPGKINNLPCETKPDSTKKLNTKTIIKKSQTKKIKTNLTTNELKTKVSPPTNDNSNINKQFNCQAKLFQENYNKNEIFNKNLSLFNITKYLVEETTPSKECENSVDELLNIINEEDKCQMNQLKNKNIDNNISFDNISKFLVGENIFDENCESDIDKLLCKINEEDKLEMVKIKEGDLSGFVDEKGLGENKEGSNFEEDCDVRLGCFEENLETFSTQNRIDSTQNGNEESVSGPVIIDEDIFVKAYDYVVSKTENVTDEYYDDTPGCTNCDEDLKNYGNSMDVSEEMAEYCQETNSEMVIDEDFFVKAYDYAVSKNENYTEVYEQVEEFSEDAVGYASDLSHPMTREIGKKRKRGENMDSRAYYEESFNYYADVLSENALNFTSTEEFDNYFAAWRRNVCSLRRIIFDSVYEREMSHFH